MQPEPFITRPLSICLDVVRAAAAIAVLMGHSVQLGLYSGPWPFSLLLQHNAVVVFFVLSGLVIATSVADGRQTLRQYAIARAARILPVAWAALILSLLAFQISVWAGDPGLEPGQYDRQMSLGKLLLPFLFLSESYTTGLPANPPFWSLCYEVWYYALFGAAWFLRGAKRLITLAIIALLTGPNALLLLPAWLIGVALARSGGDSRIPPAKAPVYLLTGLLSFGAMTWLAAPTMGFVTSHALWNLGFSLYVISDVSLSLAVAICFIALRPLSERIAPLLLRHEKPLRSLAGFSFSLYLLHWPLLVLLRTFGISAGGNFALYLVLLIAVSLVCAGFAWLTERPRYAVRAMLERIMPGRAGPATAAA